jgi:carboxylesterase
MGLFHALDHQPFVQTSGQPAAVLIHGFPGTPAEIRPLARTFFDAGWTVQGLLLPGFGAQFTTLGERRYPEWVEAVRQAVRSLRKAHAPVLVVGFSMGAAVAAVANAGDGAADGLVLLAPFTGSVGALNAIFPALRRTVDTIKPFRLFRLDFANPEVRRGLANFAPGLDLDDPEVQQAIRELALPTAALDEVRRVGQAARRAAPDLRVPTLVIQGAEDRVVWPQATRSFLDRFTVPVRYREVAGSHDLLDSSRPAWPAIERIVLEFAQSLAQATHT